MKESSKSPFRPKSSRVFANPKLTSFPQLPSSIYYDQITISSPNLTTFQNYSNILKTPDGSNSSLVYLKLDNTGIATYKGALKTPSLKYIFLSNTPLSRYHFYRAMTAIVFGPETLEEIDHIPIKKSERAFSIKNFELLYPYLIDGWLLTMVDPIRIFDPVTRHRRILYPPPERRKSISNNLFTSSIKKAVGQQNVSEKSVLNPQNLSQQTNQSQKSFSNDGTDFLNILEKVFFESNLNELFKSKNSKKNEDFISDIKPILTNSNNEASNHELFDSDASLFVNFVFRASALRPLNVDSIVKLLKEVLTDEISEILKLSLFHTNFYSNSALSNFIESLLDQEVLTSEDIKPLFFSVYEQFEDWNSPFSLTTTENGETNEPCLLSVPFIDFFCPFSKIIEKVDSDLYNSLLEYAGESEKERIETYRQNDDKKKEIWASLFNDDCDKFYPSTENENDSEPLFTKDQLKQCVLDLTPWDVNEQQIEVAFAYSGSPKCLFRSSLFNDENENGKINSSDLLKVAAVAGGSFEIFNRINNDSENLIGLAENSILFHRFELFKEIIASMSKNKSKENKNETENDVSELSSLIGVAVDSMEINAINYIICVKKTKIDKDTKAALLDRSISSFVSVKNDLDQTSKSHFVDPLNSLLSGPLSLQKSFIIFLYKIGFRSSDSLIFSIQSQSLSLIRFFILKEETSNNAAINNKNDVLMINRRGWDHLRWTPLHFAANIGSAEIVKELMKVQGINVNLRDVDGNTPLMIAVSNNHNEVVKELLRGKRNQKRAKSLQRMNQSSNKKMLTSVVDPNIADKYGWTPLSIAIGNKNVDIVRMILDYNKSGKRIDVNQVAFINNSNNDDGDDIDIDIDNHSNGSTEAAAAAGSGLTPLILAIDVGDEEIFNLLLNRSDIDVNSISLGGDSALSIAVKKRNLQFINDIISTKKVKKEIIVKAIKVANDLGLTEIAQLLNNFIS